MNAFPSLAWNGGDQHSGASTTDATGLPYRARILGMLPEPSAFKITVNSVAFTRPTGSIDLDIEVMEGGIDVSNMVLRMAVTEDHVSYGGDVYHDVLHDMIPDVPITVSSLGQVQNVNTTFPVSSEWVEANMEIVAFLQDDTDKKIHAAASTLPTPDYSLRYYALGSLSAVGPSSGTHYYDDFAIFNMGNLSDSYTVNMTGDVPAGWFAGICDDAICYGDTYTTSLAPGESKELHLMLIPVSPGYTKLSIEMSQANLVHDFPRVLNYSYITDDVDVLIVDDDGAETYEDYVTAALDTTTYTYGVWDRLALSPDATTLSNFSAVVWITGLNYPTVDADDRAALSGYLDGGGALFITGQDIGWELNDQGGAALTWYWNYLHANYIADDTNDYTLSGVPGDPVSHGLDLVITGGDGANNQQYPDDIDPRDAFATAVWTYSATQNGAIRVDTGTYKLVYLSFGYEAIDNPTDRAAVLQQSLDWMLLPPQPAGWVEADAPLLIAKGPGSRFTFNWGNSCLVSDIDYEIYEGMLGDWESHIPVACTTDGLTTKVVPPSIGDKYYLVVPTAPFFEGSYGQTSRGTERPVSTAACLSQLIGECD
jgi:hypothetical protein